MLTLTVSNGLHHQVMPIAEQQRRAQSRLCEHVLACAATRVALIQRSCGYAPRPTLSIADIARAVKIIKAQSAECAVVVDNCYGEFTEAQEPCAVRMR